MLATKNTISLLLTSDCDTFLLNCILNLKSSFSKPVNILLSDKAVGIYTKYSACPFAGIVKNAGATGNPRKAL